MTRQLYTHTVAGPGGRLLVGGAPPPPRYRGQVAAALAASVGALAGGLAKGYTSPALFSLRRDAALAVSGQQAGWVASAGVLGALAGAPLGGAAVRGGRRRALMLAGAPLSLCWLAVALAGSVEGLCAAAFLGGALVAAVQLAAQVYVGEIAAPAVRGGLSGALRVATHAGVLAAYAAGAFLDWRRLAALIAVAPAVMCVALWAVPESPGFLVLTGKHEEAERALRWLRGDGADLRFELALLHHHLLRRPAASHPLLLLRTLRTPALLACGLMFFQRFSGANAFHFYAAGVLDDTFGGTDARGAAVAVAAVQLLAAVLSGLLVDAWGRLPLLVASSATMSLALACFGSYAYYEEAHQPKGTDWMPLLCVLVFTVAFSLGISPVSWLLVTELFPLEHRGLGAALATSFSHLCSFAAVKTFVDFRELLGLHGAFWLYAAIAVCGLCFVVCCVPETKGRALDDIHTDR